MHPVDEEKSQHLRSHMRRHVQELTGEAETSGLELASIIRWLANLYENAEVPAVCTADLSGPRWGLMLRLLAEEKSGACDGLTPTHLSRFQNVSKNTISSLLRGLEEQGLIQRTLDPKDRRLFRIQLTEYGRRTVEEEAPPRIRHLNELASGLSPLEKEQLIDLLYQLYRSVAAASPNLKEYSISRIHPEEPEAR
jgi:DNA-binding MarR family transcriptional regulator